MDFSVKCGNPDKQRSACVVAGIYESRRLTPAAEHLDAASAGYIDQIIRKGDMDGKPEQSLLLHKVPGVSAERVLLIGCGKQGETTARRYRDICGHATRLLNESGATEAASYLTELEVDARDTAWKVRLAVETSETTIYRFEQLKSKQEPHKRPLRKLILSVPARKQVADGENAVRTGQAIAHGMNLARELGDLPGNVCTPSYLAERARDLHKDYPALAVTVLNEAKMKKLGMGALLSVSQGSEEPAKLIVMEHRGGRRNQKPVVLVGKGVTFDSGGISIKPGASMDEMKFDMCGAASVFGTLRACAELKLPINVVGVVPATENLPDGKASKPGDIVTSLSGQTIEILNTDAEGRLILCDALSYAKKLDPEVVIDIATLTGACIVALGKHPHGLLGNSDALTQALLDAGEVALDRAWQLPLWDEYQDQLKSNFADMANIGGRDAGAITAACFLSRFTKDYQWAHLDIAGTAWLSGDKKGATGRPVPLLVQFLMSRIETQS